MARPGRPPWSDCQIYSTDSSDRLSTSNKGDDCDDQEHNKQYLCNRRRRTGNAAKSEYPGNDRDDKERNRPTQHVKSSQNERVISMGRHLPQSRCLVSFSALSEKCLSIVSKSVVHGLQADAEDIRCSLLVTPLRGERLKQQSPLQFPEALADEVPYRLLFLRQQHR